MSRQNVEDDVGGMNAVTDRLGTSGLDCLQTIGEHRGEDADHLAVAIIGAGELAPNAFYGGW